MQTFFLLFWSLLLAAPLWAAPFRLVSTFRSPGKNAEIVSASPDGKTLIYTDSLAKKVAWVDISNAQKPHFLGSLTVASEPTSVEWAPDGKTALATLYGGSLLVLDPKKRAVLRQIALGGQPDAVTWSHDGRFAAIAVENERGDMKKAMPQNPPGFLAILDAKGPISRWKIRRVTLGSAKIRFPGDPEPEYCSINAQNVVAVTLQENNGVAIVDLQSGKVLKIWSCGTVTHAADLKKDGKIAFTDVLQSAPREPDGIAWTPGGHILTANEGDYDFDLPKKQFCGGRGWSVFGRDGKVLWDAGASLEMAAAKAGLYPDKRSKKRGIEAESVKFARFGSQNLSFLGAERGNFVAVYDLTNELVPRLLQLLPTGEAPEGLCPIASRGLLVTANEGSGTLSIFAAAK